MRASSEDSRVSIQRVECAAGAASMTVTPLHVLLVEDDDAQAEMMARGLDCSRVVVHRVGSLTEALRELQSQRFDAVLLDRERNGFHQSLRDRDARLHALVENSYDAITLVGDDYRILYHSASIERVTGYTAQERLGKNIAEFLHPDDLPKIAERFAYCLEHPDELLQIEFRYLHKDGHWHYGEAIGVNRLADPSVAAIVVNHRDVTEQRSMRTALRASEDRLRHAQKMEAIGRLAGSVAHDFNNVLTVIFGYTDLLLEQFSPADARRTDVEEIRRSAERAAALTRQLLAFSR